MNPAILTDPDDSRVAYLVDKHSASIHIDRVTGKYHVHYETAVRIDDLRGGQYRKRLEPEDHTRHLKGSPSPLDKHFAPTLLELGMVLPCPTVFVPYVTHKESTFDSSSPIIPEATPRGITRRAAEVMLELAASFQGIRGNRVSGGWEFTGAKIERVPLAWCPWKFTIAWQWSRWREIEIQGQKKITLRQRFEEIQVIGYPHGFKAFEAMHRALFPKPTH
jgi:hypothetical protein